MKKKYSKPETELIEGALANPMLGLSDDPNHLENGTDEDAGAKKMNFLEDDAVE